MYLKIAVWCDLFFKGVSLSDLRSVYKFYWSFSYSLYYLFFILYTIFFPEPKTFYIKYVRRTASNYFAKNLPL